MSWRVSLTEPASLLTEDIMKNRKTNYHLPTGQPIWITSRGYEEVKRLERIQRMMDLCNCQHKFGEKKIDEQPFYRGS